MLSAPLQIVRAVRLCLFWRVYPSLSSKRRFFGLFLPHWSGINCAYAPLQSVRAIRLRLFWRVDPSLLSNRRFFGLFLPHWSGVNCAYAPLQILLFHFLKNKVNKIKKIGVLSLLVFAILLDRYLDSWYLERSL